MSSIASSSLSFGGDEVLAGEDVDLVALGQDLAGQRVDLDDALDLVAEEIDAHGELFVGRAGSSASRRAGGTCRARGSCRCARTACRPGGA